MIVGRSGYYFYVAIFYVIYYLYYIHYIERVRLSIPMASYLASDRVKFLSMTATHCAIVINPALQRHNLMVPPTDTDWHFIYKTDDFTWVRWL